MHCFVATPTQCNHAHSLAIVSILSNTHQKHRNDLALSYRARKKVRPLQEANAAVHKWCELSKKRVTDISCRFKSKYKLLFPMFFLLCLKLTTMS